MLSKKGIDPQPLSSHASQLNIEKRISGYQGIRTWLSGQQDIRFKDFLRFFSPDIPVP
jgi:hypothetical protein